MTRKRTHLVLALTSLSSSILFAGDDFTFFEQKIRPLLAERCFDCHSAEHKIKGGLRLDSRDGLLKGGESGPAITLGKPDESLLMKAVSYHDRDLKMPPKKALMEAEVNALKTWIEQGAPDPRVESTVIASADKPKRDTSKSKSWWSFQPIRKVNPPKVKDNAWPINAIDHFILAKLEEANLQPSPVASPEVLSRRLSYDLIGLPPSLAELQHPSPIKERVTSLLNSPQFGERWGRHWLDITRFAESSGGGRTLPFKDAWRYRDYVIESINANLPMDRFLTEQLAGDLLPHANASERRSHLTATGFLVLGPTNYEEQDKQMLRMDIIDEQLDTMGKAFLGMTLGCARCHDHKFDPISQHDYYALAGILRSTRVLRDYKDNVAHWIDTPLPLDDDAEVALQAKETKLAALKEALNTSKAELKKAGVDSNLNQLAPGPLEPSKLEGIIVDDAEAKLVGDWKHSRVYRTFIGAGYVTDKNEDKGAKTLTFTPKIIDGARYEVRFAYTAASDRAANFPVVVFHADGESSVTVDETLPPPIDGRFVSLGTFRFEANGEGYVLLSNTETTGFVTADAVQFIKIDEDEKKKERVPEVKPQNKASKIKGKPVLSERIKKLEDEIKVLTQNGPLRPEAMSVREDDSIEDCPIHIRGQIRNLGEVVPRGFLSIIPASSNLPPKDQSGRLELAAWLVNKNNPLTARVMANRVWLWLFGEGLVRTPDNFGTTGESPSHPELLDYLATELIESGWDLKHLVTLIVSSRTYQQASDNRVVQSDPENRLLWRQNRRRMDAESLRDTILTVSHSLDMQVGGSNINNAKAVNVNDSSAQSLEYNYQFADTRRSVYTPAFRNKRQELFEAFDFADINGPIGKRNTSTVAPQALFLMNHPFVMEQARKAAESFLKSSKTDKELIKQSFSEVLGHSPSEREANLSADFVHVSDSDSNKEAQRLENWSLFIQSLFASVEFRYLK